MNGTHLKKYLDYFWFPLIIGGLILIASLAGLTRSEAFREIVDLFTASVSKINFPLLGLIAFLEHLVILNIYFPGALVVLTSMASSAGDPQRAVITFLVILVSAFVAQCANYFLGTRLPRGRKVFSSKQLVGVSKIVFLLSYGHSHLAGISSLKAGSDGMEIRTFLRHMSLAVFLWFVFWAVAMLSLGGVTRLTENFDIITFVYVGIMFFEGFVRYWIDRRSGFAK